MNLTGKSVAIMIDQEYQELEVWYPYYRLVEAGAHVDLIATDKNKTYKSKLGYPCVSTISARNALAVNYDAVIVPGGWCPDYMRRCPDMLHFINEAVEAKKILGAICHGGWLLCNTPAFKGKTATSFFAIRADVENAGANWVDQECVVDDNLITARKPDDLPAFMKAIIDKLLD